jgi:elongation of very long chain fatty acids protein 6
LLGSRLSRVHGRVVAKDCFLSRDNASQWTQLFSQALRLSIRPLAMSLLLPSWEWNWEHDAVKFYETNFAIFAACACAYYPVIFGLRALMHSYEPFDLGGPKTKCTLNWICWWESSLAIFSIVGAFYVVPLAINPLLQGTSLLDVLCGAPMHNDPANLWTFFFMVSKVFEFGDTIFVVLRKKPLILLQHYHHLATMLYCWYATVYVWRYNNTNIYFAAMNLSVHSVMYTWYAATRTGWRSPKILMMMVTLIQLVQMVFGVSIVYAATSGEKGCTKWMEKDPTGARACLFMYFSYLVLFGKLFIDNYIFPKKKGVGGEAGEKKAK